MKLKLLMLVLVLCSSLKLSSQVSQFGFVLEYKTINSTNLELDFIDYKVNTSFHIPIWQVGLAYSNSIGLFKHDFQINFPRIERNLNSRISRSYHDEYRTFSTGTRRAIDVNSYYSLSKIWDLKKVQIGLGVSFNPNVTLYKFQPRISEGFSIDFLNSTIFTAWKAELIYKISEKFSINVCTLVNVVELNLLHAKSYDAMLPLEERSYKLLDFKRSNITPQLILKLSYSI